MDLEGDLPFIGEAPEASGKDVVMKVEEIEMLHRLRNGGAQVVDRGVVLAGRKFVVADRDASAFQLGGVRLHRGPVQGETLPVDPQGIAAVGSEKQGVLDQMHLASRGKRREVGEELMGIDDGGHGQRLGLAYGSRVKGVTPK